jgi:hypothetical protein
MWQMARKFGATFRDRHSGSWSQRRNASHCVVDFIDVASGKIVDFEILEKPIGFSDGNYFEWNGN